MEQNKDIFDAILKNTYTRKQALKRLGLIKDFLNLLFFDLKPDTTFNQALNDFEQSLIYKHSADQSSELKFLENLGANFFKQFEPQTFHIKLAALEKDLLSVKIITLYLPFELPEVEVDKLGSWFKKNLGNSSLFEINLDPNLIGGTAISINGVYKDYSLKQKIKVNQEQIEKLLTSFPK